MVENHNNLTNVADATTETINATNEVASTNNDSNIKMKGILTIRELLSSGKKVARLAGNRVIKEKSVKQKMKSLKTFGQLIPAVYVEANIVIKQGLDLVDWSTGAPIEDTSASDYIVIIDGQHRYEAHNRLMDEKPKDGEPRYNGDFYVIESLNPSAAVNKQLLEINTISNPWDGPDYARTAIMMVEDPDEYPTLQFVAELTGQGYSLPSASGWATFTDKITKTTLVNIANGKESASTKILKSKAGLERGQTLHEAAETSFGIAFRQGRLLIDWIRAQYENTPDDKKAMFTEHMTRFLKIFDRKGAEKIEALRGTRGGDTREALVNKALDKLYSSFYEKN